MEIVEMEGEGKKALIVHPTGAFQLIKK